MHYHSSEQSSSSASRIGNILSCQSLTRPLGLIAAPRKTSYTSLELIIIANKFHREGHLDKAESTFRRVLDHIPNHPLALHFLGVIALESGNSDAAIKLIKGALKSTPNYHQAYNNLGNAYEASGQIKDAATTYAKALEVKPDYTDAMFNLGLMREKLREFEEAEQILEKCIKLEPRRADVHYELGIVCAALGNRTKAQMCFHVVLSIDPENSLARLALGNLFQSVGRYDESVEQYDITIEQDENVTRALNAKGVALRKVGRFDEALDSISKSKDFDPENVETLNVLGASYQTIGDIDKATECYYRAVQLDPNSEPAHKCLLFVALNHPRLTSQEFYDIHLQVRGHFNKPDFTKKTFPDRDRNTSRRLKVGYVSSDFRTHVVSMNVLPVIANHEHEAFEVFLYGQVEFADGVTDSFKEYADHWRSTMHKSNEEVTEMIEADEIDILIFLAGRFDENRPIIATYRPAPIQVSFHDCATSGLEAMDYFLTDDILHPPGTKELFTEELYRLPVYYQYPIQHWLPEIMPAPALSNGFITFGCLNKPEKINDAVVELWADVLRAVPNSKLLLKYFNHYSEPSMRERWISRFKDNGISENRLVFKSKIEGRYSHLELYKSIDIALDPFPFNGATTTFEALSMGVPVIALLGKHFVDRVAASIVTHAGYPEFAVNTKKAYVELAKSLTNNVQNLNERRLTMRENLHKSKICRGPTYAKNIEATLRDMWTTWCETGSYKGK